MCVYVNRFGDTDYNTTYFNRLYNRLISSVIDGIITKYILPEGWKNIKEKSYIDFKCKISDNKEHYCFVIMERCRLLLRIIMDSNKYNFFKEAYEWGIDNEKGVMGTYGGSIESFQDDFIKNVIDKFLNNFEGEKLIAEEKNALAPVLLDNYRSVPGNAYWSMLPPKIAKDYKDYAIMLESVLRGNNGENILKEFISSGFKPDNILGLATELLATHPNASVGCDWKSSHGYDESKDSTDVCPICLENFKKGADVITLLCGDTGIKETIHKDCLGENTLTECTTNRQPVRGCF